MVAPSRLLSGNNSKNRSKTALDAKRNFSFITECVSMAQQTANENATRKSRQHKISTNYSPTPRKKYGRHNDNTKYQATELIERMIAELFEHLS
jgi:hypothetical protein